MPSKREMEARDLPATHKRLRSNVADLFLTNQVSAARAQSLAEDAVLAGVSNMHDLARTGDKGVCKKHSS